MTTMRLRRLCAMLAMSLVPALAMQAHAQAPGLMLTAPSADSAVTIAERFLHEAAQRRALDASDMQYVLEDESTSPLSQVTSVTFQQNIDGIPVRMGLAKVNVMRDGRVLSAQNDFATGVAQRANAATPAIGAADALRRVAAHLGIPAGAVVERVGVQLPAELRDAPNKIHIFNGGTISGEKDIGAWLVYEKRDADLRLAWQVLVNRYDTHLEVFDIRIDAHTGEVLGMNNLVQFESGKDHGHAQPKYSGHSSVYRVFAQPSESPQSPGAVHALIADPSDDAASPFGWHDTRANPPVGQPEYTDTRGNNVFAQYDLASNNRTSNPRPAGTWDAGTGTLTFDWPWDPAGQPYEVGNARAATVNLFYWNNLLHDVMFHYGFDEAAGNFQRRNYVAANRSPRNDDDVAADALDGATLATPNLNNANFLPVPENALWVFLLGKPRMQMYRWSAPGAVAVLAPFQDQYQAAPAAFGAALTLPFPGQVVLVDSGDAAPEEGCATPYANAAQVSGRIALIRRGTCNFQVKVGYAEQNGAIAAIVYNNAGDTTIAMGAADGAPAVTIPSMFIGQSGGEAIRSALEDEDVDVELLPPGDAGPDRDSDFDAGIIVHEYAHGISNRLSGRTTLSCHGSAEQQGEGWSDFYGLMFTLTPQVCEAPRGIGTYASFQHSTGPGIRRFPYSPDMGINPFTFGDTNDEANSAPHGVGSIWATMLWDMSCNLMDRYGVDADITSRQGGNGIAMSLVTEGLKLGGCDPTFVQSRNNILAADAAFVAAGNGYDSNACLIWRTFARRGLGESASSGVTTSRLDQVEAFDAPVQCRTYVHTDAGAGGGVSPQGPITLHFDTEVTFTLQPDEGFEVDTVSGCDGTRDGDTYVTGVVTEDCTVTVTFAPIGAVTHEVTPVVIGNGSLDPATVQVVTAGDSISFEVMPAINHHLVDVDGCAGGLVDSTYTTGAITADCTVTATFAINSFLITPVAGAGGSIMPADPFNADYGTQPELTVTPAPGHAIDTVTGCDGNLDENTYTLAPVTAACTVQASFIALPPEIFADGFEGEAPQD